MYIETPKAMGQMANAPLAFVLAQVRFSEQSSEFTHRLQHLLDQLEPGRFMPAQPQPIQRFTFDPSAENPMPTPLEVGFAYHLVRKDAQVMVRVAPDSLTLAVTDYENSTKFRELWFPMVGCLGAAKLSGPVQRLGLRYVDFILPTGNRIPEDYVVAPWSLQDFPKLPGAKDRPSLHVSLQEIEFDQGRMRLQFHRGYGKPMLPMDLGGMLQPQLGREHNGLSAIIDTDRWIEGSWSHDDLAIAQSFISMHSDVGNVFKAMMSPHAKTEWEHEQTEGFVQAAPIALSKGETA